MYFVLGIDAAWTETEPSGIALIGFEDQHSVVLCVAPSYLHFAQAANGSPVEWNTSPVRGTKPDIAQIISSARKLGADRVDLIALDIPLANTPITSRRASDKAVSRAYGSKGCSTHSPSANRPGPISDDLGRQLKNAGYELATCSPETARGPRAIEVYPHPALLTLLNRDYRIPYKVANTSKYWKKTPLVERRLLLLNELKEIYRSLEADLGTLPFCIPPADEVSAISKLKRFEDALDALVCAWVGKRHLRGQTTPYGDANSTIWIP